MPHPYQILNRLGPFQHHPTKRRNANLPCTCPAQSGSAQGCPALCHLAAIPACHPTQPRLSPLSPCGWI